MRTGTTSIHEVLVIDQAPLFAEALHACQLACRAIGALKDELQRFETEDLPSYDRWFNTTFGQNLTELRERSAELHQRQALLASTKKKHWAKFFGGATGTAAADFGGPEISSGATFDEEELAGFRVHDAEDEDDGRHGPSFEQTLYDEAASTYDDEEGHHYGEDADAVRKFENLFVKSGAWKRNSAYQGRTAPDEAEKERSTPSGNAPREDTRSPQQLQRGRLKERYRILVKKLHPDMNPSLTTEEKKLWLQVQTAYQTGDLEQLDVLLALSDAFSGKISDSTSLGQLRRAAVEIERLIEPLRRKVEEVREHRAWGFSVNADPSRARRLVEREFHLDLLRLKAQLDEIERQLRRFARPAREPEELATGKFSRPGL